VRLAATIGQVCPKPPNCRSEANASVRARDHDLCSLESDWNARRTGVDSVEGQEIEMTLSRVVVGADGSRGAAPALEWTVKLARHSDTEVVVVHAITPGEARKTTIADLDAWCTDLRDAQIAYRCILVEDADPRLVLPEIAEQEDADLIVVGSRGQNAITQLVVGSVGQYLLHHAPRPVAVIRPELTDDTPARAAAAT
jgi:nucleotide-binding universal stress UspA family protein